MDSLITEYKLDEKRYNENKNQSTCTQLRKSIMKIKKFCTKERKNVLVEFKIIKSLKKEKKISEDKILEKSEESEESKISDK